MRPTPASSSTCAARTPATSTTRRSTTSTTSRCRSRAWTRCGRTLRSALGEPPPSRTVVKHDRVLAALEHDLEISPHDGLLRPPAVEDAPLLADERDRLVVHLPRRPVERRLDHPRARLVQSSRGTKSARVSGIRDHGATSTTVQT